jgi:methyl-accepting chemotaxis protein
MQHATEESVNAIKVFGLTIERISEITKSISSAVKQQGASTQYIAEDVEAAPPVAPSMPPRTSSVSPAEPAKRKRHQVKMLGSAQALSEVSIHLRDEVEKFLDSVRAA